MKCSKTLLFSLLTLTVTATCAQRIKITDGDLSPLKNEKSIRTEFTYNNMSVGKKGTEADYVNKKKDEYNKKEAGKGDQWATAWVADRNDKYQPKFNELFEKSSDMDVNGKDARYTLVYNTNYVEPGYNIGVMRHNAETSATVEIVENATKKVIAKMEVDKAQGRTFWGTDYDTGGRIAECYADAGKALGYYIKAKSK